MIWATFPGQKDAEERMSVYPFIRLRTVSLGKAVGVKWYISFSARLANHSWLMSRKIKLCPNTLHLTFYVSWNLHVSQFRLLHVSSRDDFEIQSRKVNADIKPVVCRLSLQHDLL